jgi:hypothetical protein
LKHTTVTSTLTLTLTSCHPVWVESKACWCCVDPTARRAGRDDGVVTSQLEVGDVLRGVDGDAMTVCGVDAVAPTLDDEGLPTSTAVYNLTISDTHVYFAGGVLVHNNSGMVAPLTFSDLSTAHCTEWNSAAPDYRTADPGLNFEAKCPKAACASRRDGKLVVLAVGRVDNEPLAELLCDRTCPSVSIVAVVVSLHKLPSDAKTSRVQCGAEVSPTDIKTLAFSNCTWEYTGLLAPPPLAGLLPRFFAFSLRYSLTRSFLDALLIFLPQSPLRHVGLLDRTSG